MSSKLRERCLLLLAFVIVGLSISLFAITYRIPQVLATATPEHTLVKTQSATDLEAQGKYFYSLNQFEQAISLWQEAVQIYVKAQDPLSQGRVLSNIALAHSQLNNWEKATENITASLDLVNQESQITSVDRILALAQVLNNQGILQLAQGQVEQAIATWQQAKVNYQQVEDELGVIRASINQASAFKKLGLYRRALKTLAQVENQLAQQPDSLIKTTGLRSYGNMLRLVGRVEKAQSILEQSLTIASRLESNSDRVKTLLALGNIYRAKNNQKKALEFYQQGLNTCHKDRACFQTNLPLQIYLVELHLFLDTKYWQRGRELIPAIQSEFARLPNTRTNTEKKINFAHSLIKLRQKSVIQRRNLSDIPSWSAIDRFLNDAIQQATILDEPKMQSYGLGLRGQIGEQLQKWKVAQRHTQQALILAQGLNAPEIIYLWQWQLGRINQALNDRPQAIAHYSQAVELLKSLSQDLVAIDPDIQYSFRDSVEPVYRGLVNLLLTTDRGKEISQANLEKGREIIESLQLAELHNFFREACLDVQAVNVDSVDRQAAVIYPIILGDRLEVILSLPHQPLQHYATPISQAKLEKTIEQFRQGIVVRSRRYFYRPARQLYDLLIRPAIDDLANNKIKTIVFVPDGAFRNIPLGALYDGKRYLIEDYSVALTPGLQLLTPRPLEQVELKTIAAGLTKRRQGFSALSHVNSELNQIKDTVNSVVLLNKEFTTEALQEEIKFSDYPIVHIATHGQFSSSLENTFLLAWNNRINIDELDSILQTRNPSQENAIELLVLSACETATGDKWAALGLAGMAVRAGARSTLATLWSVNDRATAELMSDFYHELADKQLPKAEAVRQAQLSLLHNRWYRHPFYWAPYVLLGNWL